MKKTALTMTDSERQGSSGTDKAPAPTEFPRKSAQEENQALRSIIEQQEIAMDMIMRKYREQMDGLTISSHTDVRKLYYKRFLDTVISQANKMDHMTKMMRKNLLVIFKYEEIMIQIESENEDLRSQVRKLLAVAMAEKRKGTKNDAESQTDLVGNLTANKSVGTSTECDIIKKEKVPEKQDNCSVSNDFADFGTAEEHCPQLRSLDVDAALDLYVSRFSEEIKTPVNSPRADTHSEDKLEELSDVVSTTTDLLTDVDELSSDNSVVSLTEDSCSKQDFPDVLSTSL